MSEANPESRTTKLPRPDFGINTIEIQGMPMTCRYIAPGLTLHDLTMIFERAKKDPRNNPIAGNPSLWPEVAGVQAVVNAVLDAIFEPEETGDVRSK